MTVLIHCQYEHLVWLLYTLEHCWDALIIWFLRDFYFILCGCGYCSSNLRPQRCSFYPFHYPFTSKEYALPILKNVIQLFKSNPLLFFYHTHRNYVNVIIASSHTAGLVLDGHSVTETFSSLNLTAGSNISTNCWVLLCFLLTYLWLIIIVCCWLLVICTFFKSLSIPLELSPLIWGVNPMPAIYKAIVITSLVVNQSILHEIDVDQYWWIWIVEFSICVLFPSFWRRDNFECFCTRWCLYIAPQPQPLMQNTNHCIVQCIHTEIEVECF